MDPDHHSKEYENAFMPDSMFFDLKGHAIHGFNDTPHLGMAVSHGCVRLSPANAATLFDLVKDEGMADTTVIVSGHIPARNAPLVAQRQAPTVQASTEQPMPIAPGYGQPAPYGAAQPYGQSTYDAYGEPAFPPQPAPAYGYGRPTYYQPSGQAYYRQPDSGYYQQPQYGQPYSPY